MLFHLSKALLRMLRQLLPGGAVLIGFEKKLESGC